MGLTISYQLHSPARTCRAAAALVESLRQKALELPFARVGPVVGTSAMSSTVEPAVWCFDVRLPGGEYTFRARATRQFSFVTEPGDGCEAACFGLCRFPGQILVDHPTQPARMLNVRTGASGWRWWSYCKTQYAGHPQCGGVINFVRCHLLVIRLLDLAHELGIQADVNDESGFWRDRDPAALARQVGDWDPPSGDRDSNLRQLLEATRAESHPPHSATAGDQPCRPPRSF